MSIDLSTIRYRTYKVIDKGKLITCVTVATAFKEGDKSILFYGLAFKSKKDKLNRVIGKAVSRSRMIKYMYKVPAKPVGKTVNEFFKEWILTILPHSFQKETAEII